MGQPTNSSWVALPSTLNRPKTARTHFSFSRFFLLKYEIFQNSYKIMENKKKAKPVLVSHDIYALNSKYYMI
jgi:hypothetical protein